MGDFKRAWRITVLGGRHKILISGLICAVFLNVVMIFTDRAAPTDPNKWLIRLSMTFMGLGVPSMIGNADLSGHCRAVMTSKMRKYIYGKFYSGVTLLAVFVMYAVQFAALYIAALAGMSDITYAGEESIMIALILCIGTVNMGLLFCGKYGCIVSSCSTALAIAWALGYIAFPAQIPVQLSGEPLLCFICGVGLILAGAAAQYFIRRKCYNKRSYPWGKNTPEEMAEIFGH